MDEIISGTLTLARQGAVVNDTEPISVPILVNNCWASVATDKATIECEDQFTITGDPERLKHVFENLFRNAVEHGGRDITVTVDRIDDAGFYVEDSGPGIPTETRENIFDAGYTSTDSGTGFGLAIVRRIAEAHGWEVTVTDATQGGARFEFTGVDVDS
jgi:signal transduction histidine kinase